MKKAGLEVNNYKLNYTILFPFEKFSEINSVLKFF